MRQVQYQLSSDRDVLSVWNASSVPPPGLSWTAEGVILLSRSLLKNVVEGIDNADPGHYDGMRGDDRQPTAMFSDFDGLYARVGQPSIPPERLLRRAADCNCSTRAVASGC